MDGAEIARRIQAARGYARLKRPALAERLGIHLNTLVRYEDPNVKGSVPNTGMRIAIAAACGVRRDWFDESFSLRDQPEARRTNEPAEDDVRGMGVDLSLADDGTEASGRTRA